MAQQQRKHTHWIYDVPKGSPANRKKFFYSYAEAREYIRTHIPGDKGIYHIYPVDNSGYTSKSDGRKSFGHGNKSWMRSNKGRRP